MVVLDAMLQRQQQHQRERNDSPTGKGSANEYLSPYVQPPPTDFDPKNNPLAMLTRTCDRIGSDFGIGPASSSTSSSAAAALAKAASAKINGSLPDSLDRPINFSRPKSSSSSGSPPTTIRSPSSASSSLSPVSSRHSSTTPKSPATAPKKTPTPPASTSSPSTAPPVSVTASVPSTSPYAGLCTDPLCRDPGCPTFAYRNAQMMAAAAHFAGFGRSALPLPGAPPPGFLPLGPAGMFGPPHPGLPVSLASPPSGGSAFVCNWIEGSGCCGRRFSTSDDLMSHLRTHTSNASTSSSAVTSTNASSSSITTSSTSTPSTTASNLATLQAAQAQAMLAGSPTNALAALQAQAVKAASDHRFHPYGRPSPAVSSATAAVPFPPPLPFGVSPAAAAAAAAAATATPPFLLYP